MSLPEALPDVNAPVAAAEEAVIFFHRDEGASEFETVRRRQSLTLRELADEFSISSVLECDPSGRAQPRAVALDSPSDVLHSGRHYIARRDAKTSQDGSNRVVFRSKIIVKEYELDPSSTPSVTHQATPLPLRLDDQVGPFLTATGTPFFYGPPSSIYSAEKESLFDAEPWRESSIGAKRQRAADDEEEGQQHSRKQRGGDDSDGAAVVSSSRDGCLADRTNQCPTLPMGTKRDVGSVNAQQQQAPPQPQVRYMPFKADVDGSGAEVLVTLDHLKQICANAEQREAEYVQQHEEASRIMESARRLLFSPAK